MSDGIEKLSENLIELCDDLSDELFTYGIGGETGADFIVGRLFVPMTPYNESNCTHPCDYKVWEGYFEDNGVCPIRKCSIKAAVSIYLQSKLGKIIKEQVEWDPKYISYKGVQKLRSAILESAESRGFPSESWYF